MFNKPVPELRFQTLNPYGRSPDDEIFLQMLQQYPPRTAFKSGDLVSLLFVPDHLRGQGPLPAKWKVRAVYSKWQMVMFDLVEKHGGYLPWPLMLTEATRYIPIGLERRESIVMGHPFPEGHWVNALERLPEECLKKDIFQAPTPDWALVLDELKTPFLGHERDWGITHDGNPSIYADQRQRARPLSFEENAFHLACLYGKEEEYMVPSIFESPYRSYTPSNMFDHWENTGDDHDE